MSGPHVSIDPHLAVEIEIARHERWLDPDPLEPTDIDRAYALGFADAWDATKPAPARRDRLGAVIAIAATVALLVVAFAAGRASAAPRAVPGSSSIPVGGASSQGQLGAPRSGMAVKAAAEATWEASAPADGVGAPEPTDPPAVAGGLASWYDDGPGLYAAVPSWHFGDRPYGVRVIAGGRSVVVTIRDFCGCPGGRIIDLSPDAFGELAPLSRGVIPVVLEDLAGPEVTPPPTDVAVP